MNFIISGYNRFIAVLVLVCISREIPGELPMVP